MSLLTLEQWAATDLRSFAVRRSSNGLAVGIQDALETGITGIISHVGEDTKEQIFYMLCFCLIVPQSRAVKADEAVNNLRSLDFYNRSLSARQLQDLLKTLVRFHNRKSEYLLLARTVFVDDADFWNELLLYYKNWIGYDLDSKRNIRKDLKCKFKGAGPKEISHFLRNIGMPGLAILDVHVLNRMKERHLIDADTALTNSNYSAIEDIMIEYASKVGIKIEELDLLFWSEGTGFVFK